MPAFSDGRSDEIAAALEALPSGTPVSEVAGRLLNLFTSGSIEPGTRLPPERQLAANLGVGRSAVREALAALEVLGIVDVRPSSGTYLRGTASDLLPQALRWGLLIGSRSTAELLEFRSGLEIYVARLAASRISPDALSDLGRQVQLMKDSLGNMKVVARADMDFHRGIAAAAGNDVLIDMLQVVRSLLRVYADRAVHDAHEAEVALQEHAAIFRALGDGDGDAAASAMALHMATASARLSAPLA